MPYPLQSYRIPIVDQPQMFQMFVNIVHLQNRCETTLIFPMMWESENSATLQTSGKAESLTQISWSQSQCFAIKIQLCLKPKVGRSYSRSQCGRTVYLQNVSVQRNLYFHRAFPRNCHSHTTSKNSIPILCCISVALWTYVNSVFIPWLPFPISQMGIFSCFSPSPLEMKLHEDKDFILFTLLTQMSKTWYALQYFCRNIHDP